MLVSKDTSWVAWHLGHNFWQNILHKRNLNATFPCHVVLHGSHVATRSGIFVVLSQVMESTNRGMEVLWGTRLSDGQQCVVKTRQKAFQCLFDSRSV